jgi:hypothetical protein
MHHNSSHSSAAQGFFSVNLDAHSVVHVSRHSPADQMRCLIVHPSYRLHVTWYEEHVHGVGVDAR